MYRVSTMEEDEEFVDITDNTEELDAERTVCVEEEKCEACRKGFYTHSFKCISCDSCSAWYHIECAGVSESQYNFYKTKGNSDTWVCQKCCHVSGSGLSSSQAIDALRSTSRDSILGSNEETKEDVAEEATEDTTPLPDVVWGNMTSRCEIELKIRQVYNVIVTWKKNIFQLPRGRLGKDFITELTRLINLFNFDTPWRSLALSKVHIFMPLMLQRPSAKSKARDNAKYLQKRLLLWKEGDLDKIMSECREIQKRIKVKVEKEEVQRRKAFCRLMMAGKVAKALNFIDHDEEATVGVLPINSEVVEKLKAKHPPGASLNEEAVLPESNNYSPEAVIFEAIDKELITKCSKQISGAGGPTLIDADSWKHIICSKFYGTLSGDLAEAIACLAKKLCTETIEPEAISELLASRLIPLDKGKGAIRPIGIGETLRRIVSKSVTSILKQDIQIGAGNLQTCSGVEGGIEAAIHAMRITFNEESSEAMLLVDATNAFNAVNRKVALKNIKELCPPYYRFLHNCYQSPTKLFLSGSGNFIYSEEGATQGDPAAMQMYALSTNPLINKVALKPEEKTI